MVVRGEASAKMALQIFNSPPPHGFRVMLVFLATNAARMLSQKVCGPLPRADERQAPNADGQRAADYSELVYKAREFSFAKRSALRST
ncbi:hypothetical protein MRX96_040909 [Rhipicephalus microplus]